MSKYRELFSITIAHQYYGDGACPIISLSLNKVSRKLALQLSLIVKTRPGKLTAYYNAQTLHKLKAWFSVSNSSEPLSLSVLLHASAADFFLVTANLPNFNTHLWHSLCKSGVQQTYFDEDNCIAKASLDSTSLNSDLSSKGPVLSVIDVSLNDCLQRIEDAGDISQDYHYHFLSLTTYWKYLLLNTDENSEYEIIEDQAKYKFAAQDNESIGNRLARVYLSEKRIPLTRQSAHKAKLVSVTKQHKNVIFNCLPVASHSQLFLQQVAGKQTAVSEIFINLP